MVSIFILIFSLNAYALTPIEILDNSQALNHFENGDLNSAQKILEQLVVQNYDEMFLHYNLAMVLHENKEPEKAIKEYEMVIKNTKDSALQEKASYNLARLYFNKAIELQTEADDDGAIDYFLKSSQTTP